MQLLDYSESQLLELTIFDFINPYNLKGDLESLVAVVRSDTDYCKFQNGYLTARGDRVWGQLTIVRIPANEPDSHFLIGVFEDPANHKFDAPALRSDNLAALGDKSWEIDKGLIGVN